MPRQPRLDAPGALHHIIGRGIEGITIFREEADRQDFINRLAILCHERSIAVYAWALMSNHFHLLIRTGLQPLSTSMRKILTGYAVHFNRRYERCGHLFHNRYKSIVCQDDPYLLELTRYIHLNPVRAGIVESLNALCDYRWTGHGVIMGRIKNNWQDAATVYSYFSKKKKEAIARYEAFISEGIAAGHHPEQSNEGLFRSADEWAQVQSFRSKGTPVSSDERILGSGEFIQRLIAETERRVKETLRLRKRVPDLKKFAERIAKLQCINKDLLMTGCRSREVARARKIFCQVVVKKAGYSGAEAARFLGVSTSAVNRLANDDELPEVVMIISC